MRAKVLTTFTDKNWFTRSKGQDFVTEDEAYLASLVDEGKVELVDAPKSQDSSDDSADTDEVVETSVKSKARKASKKDERKTVLPRRRRR